MASSPRSVLVFGSTGSIGRNALEVIRSHPDRFSVAGLVCRASLREMLDQWREFRPPAIAVLNPELAEEARNELGNEPVEVREGLDGVLSLFDEPGGDTALIGIAGAAGLTVTAEAVRRGLRVALANKESLVMAGPALLAEADRSGAEVLPVDSEHCAIAQAMMSGRPDEVHRVWLTASGGALRDRPLDELAAAKPADALRHPNWDMGRRITVDSATLMNKALEVVEAVHLFDLPPDRVEVVLHRQSVVHSMVEFRDGSVMAQLGRPDMRLPILWALAHPERLDVPEFRMAVTDLARLDFDEPDAVRYPGLALGYEAARRGGLAGAVLNGADERAVELFLEERLAFGDIVPAVAAALDGVDTGPDDLDVDDLDGFLERASVADGRARDHVDAFAFGEEEA